ncbi:ABC transporter ATP-binding protein [Actinophytocola sp.]|uniref:ABC transporter ATP-binding protein n=1 Tax=Actinophytocola sp. TaxID=1872138 RepID=UPI003D6BA442
MSLTQHSNRAGGSTDHGADIVFDGIGKVFVTPELKAFTAVDGVDLSVEPGSFVSIIGPSGCGKSTLLNMVAGLMEPTSGEVRYRGVPVTSVNTDVGYMTQKDNLLPWRTVTANVRIPLEISGSHSRSTQRAMVRDVLERVGLAGFEDRYPAELSGGMRKRVALARSLVYNPNTLLMDEPFGALDAQLRVSLQAQLLALWERDHKTVLFVTHDIEEAILLADRVVVFGTNPGHVKHVEQITLDRPRELTKARTSPETVEIMDRLAALIEPAPVESGESVPEGQVE